MPEQQSERKLSLLKRIIESEPKLENALILLKEKLGLIIFILSIIAGVGLTWQLLRKYPPKHNLTIATFAQGGEYYAFETSQPPQFH